MPKNSKFVNQQPKQLCTFKTKNWAHINDDL